MRLSIPVYFSRISKRSQYLWSRSALLEYHARDLLERLVPYQRARQYGFTDRTFLSLRSFPFDMVTIKSSDGNGGPVAGDYRQKRLAQAIMASFWTTPGGWFHRRTRSDLVVVISD